MGYHLGLSDDDCWFLMPAYQFYGFATRNWRFGTWKMIGRNGWEVLQDSTPILLSIVLFAFLARLGLLRRAFVAPRNRALQLFRWLDRPMHALNRRFGGVVLAKDRSLPGSDPVAWRETSRRLLGSPQYLVRLGILLEFPLLMLCILIYGAHNDYWRQVEEYSAVMAAIGGLAVLAIIVKAANAVASERVHGTLEVLLTTPLDGAAILRQKMSGVNRLSLAFAVPLATVALFEAIAESGSQHAYYYDSSYRIDTLSYVFGMALSIVVYPSLFAWGSLWVALRSGSRARAMVVALVLAVGWMVGPVVVAGFFSLIWRESHVSPFNVLLLLSPAALPVCIEMDEFRMFAIPPLVMILVNFAFYIFLWLRLKSHCLRHADRLLGRA